MKAYLIPHHKDFLGGIEVNTPNRFNSIVVNLPDDSLTKSFFWHEDTLIFQVSLNINEKIVSNNTAFNKELVYQLENLEEIMGFEYNKLCTSLCQSLAQLQPARNYAGWETFFRGQNDELAIAQ